MQRLIASIFFDDTHVSRPLYAGDYRIPAVAKGDMPFLLRIDDKIQMEPMPHIIGGGAIPRRITADEIARDIVDDLTSKGFGMSIECAPGIWIVREELPEIDDEGKPVMTTVFDDKGRPVQRQAMRPATPQEKEQMFAEDLDEAKQKQHNYCEYLINRGDFFNDEPEKRVLITPRMKKAAIYAARDVEWLQDLKHDDTRSCPFCTKAVRAKAVKCPHCQEVIDYERFAEMEADRKEAIADAKRRRQAA